MKIAANCVVSLEFILRDDEGDILDESGGDPLEYLHGHSQLVPGLERRLEGLGVGEKFEVTVAPIDGYGERDENRLVEIDRSEFPAELTPEIGMELNAEGPEGEPVTLWVAHLTDQAVTVDGNHPLAGQALYFSGEVVSVRAATEEEKEHGHAHGPGHDH